jgi:long-subunit acyl-CoA synthetase (AMP-forming)
MPEAFLLHHLVSRAADRAPAAPALTHGSATWTYETLALEVDRVASALAGLALPRGARVGIYLEKRFEMVVAAFAAAATGGAFVPVNPLLKAEQVGFILRDCNVRVLVTSPERLAGLQEELGRCPDLAHVVLTDRPAGLRVVDTDMTAILYTSGSTGRPKGVVLSHRNMVAGAKSVASYLGNHAGDTLLAALPLSFDAGFSQLTTAFHAARAWCC